jgi:hypothetical protein
MTYDYEDEYDEFDEYEDELYEDTPIELYLKNTESYSKEAVDELINAYNGDINGLASNFSFIDDYEYRYNEKFKELTDKTILDVVNRIAEKLKETLERANTIYTRNDTTSKELFEMKAFSERVGFSIASINTSPTYGEVLPKEIVDELYELGEKTHQTVDKLIADITKDALIARAIQLKDVANLELRKTDAFIPDKELEHQLTTDKVCDEYIYYKLKTEAFEEEHFNPENLFIEKSWDDMNMDLFMKKVSKEEILDDMLLSMNSLDERMNFMKFLFKEYEAYAGERERNMGRLLEAYADMAEYEIGKLKMKVCALAEDDKMKASIISACKQQYESIKKFTNYISTEYRDYYHPEIGDAVMKKMMYIDSGAISNKLPYTSLELMQMRRFFPEIKEKDNELNKLHEKQMDENDGLDGVIAQTEQAKEYRQQVIDIKKEMDDILENLVSKEVRNMELINSVL